MMLLLSKKLFGLWYDKIKVVNFYLFFFGKSGAVGGSGLKE